MAITETNLRAGTRSALLADFQASKGAVVDDLSSAENLWASPVEHDIAPIKSIDEWMSSSPLTDKDERINKATKPFGSFRSIATPATLARILRSNWGPTSGSSFTLQNEIESWLTMLWLENRNSPTLGTAVRIRDAWIHRIRFEEFDGLVRIHCEWAARTVEQFTPLPGTVILPASPVPDGSILFPIQEYRITRDPDGVDQEFSAEALTVEIDQRLVHQWDMTDGTNLRKGGKTKILVNFTTRVNDEGWGILQRSVSATKEPWRIELLGIGATLTIDLAAAEFAFNPIGRDALNLKRLEVSGKAFVDGMTSASVTLSQ